jgi:hypothetical protein
MSSHDFLSVWPVAQRAARDQRTGRYLPKSTAHPGKMLPELARTAIRHYSEPGDLIVDSMCGIGTTLVEAMHLEQLLDALTKWSQLCTQPGEVLAVIQVAVVNGDHLARGLDELAEPAGGALALGELDQLANAVTPAKLLRSVWCRSSCRPPTAGTSTTRSILSSFREWFSCKTRLSRS